MYNEITSRPAVLGTIQESQKSFSDVLSLSFCQGKTAKQSTNMINHQSDDLKNRKFDENFLEYANFSTFSGKGHKTKDQFL